MSGLDAVRTARAERVLSTAMNDVLTLMAATDLHRHRSTADTRRTYRTAARRQRLDRACELAYRRLDRARQAELGALVQLRCVTGRDRAECPICLTPYDELGFPHARGDGAFRCSHSICYGCSARLLRSSVANPNAYACPLCRAARVLPESEPGWLCVQQQSGELRRATEELQATAERSLAAALQAASTALQQMALLQRQDVPASSAQAAITALQQMALLQRQDVQASPR